jgi:hypothetical protein
MSDRQSMPEHAIACLVGRHICIFMCGCESPMVGSTLHWSLLVLDVPDLQDHRARFKPIQSGGLGELSAGIHRTIQSTG